MSEQYVPERYGQVDVFNLRGSFEEWGNVGIVEASYAASDASNQKLQLRMIACKVDEIVHIRFNSFYTALHSGNGVAVSA